ncbi:MAG: flavodoxin family protein [Desulfobacteraceae bacterium]|nr:flavodoxin family protein [Desulfobacteraceae bacterium]
MERAVIIYGSVTGATEEIAYALADEINDRYKTRIVNALDATPETMTRADLIILGASTWGVGNLQMDMIPVYEYISGMDLSSKRAAVFGKGDSEYKKFCYAVIMLEKVIKKAGAQLVQKGFRCDKHFDEAAMHGLKQWASCL